MVVHNFDRIWPSIGPNKTDAVLLINPDAMLTFSIPLESLQVITGRDTQFIERSDRVKLIELPSSYSPQRLRTPSASSLRVLTVKNVLSSYILERPNHNSPVLHSRYLRKATAYHSFDSFPLECCRYADSSPMLTLRPTFQLTDARM